jgi:hypothetical protein
METFKYSLDKTSKKYVCPSCNKKTFVYYVDTVSGNYLTTDFGRCDREQNCNYHKAPAKGKRAYLIAFLSLKDITDKASKLVDLNGVIHFVPKSQLMEQNGKSCFIAEWFLKTSTICYLDCESKYFDTGNIINEVITLKPPDEVKPDYYGMDLLHEMFVVDKIQDNLTTFLKTKFTPDEIDTAASTYFITGTDCIWNNSNVFWQIDEHERIRGAKVMQYDKDTGKRIKEPRPRISWLHKVLNVHSYNLSQCLFGLHRITRDYQKDIAIVESEKTAIILSIILPDFIWLATGSKSGFKRELLQPLKNRNVFAFPDKGEYAYWSKTATELNNSGFKIAVSDLLEQTDFNNGFDLADYYLFNPY